MGSSSVSATVRTVRCLLGATRPAGRRWHFSARPMASPCHPGATWLSNAPARPPAPADDPRGPVERAQILDQIGSSCANTRSVYVWYLWTTCRFSGLAHLPDRFGSSCGSHTENRCCGDKGVHSRVLAGTGGLGGDSSVDFQSLVWPEETFDSLGLFEDGRDEGRSGESGG